MFTDEKRCGVLVRDLRLRRGWRQKDLAEKAELSLNYLSLVEGGRRGVSPETVLKLLKVVAADKEDWARVMELVNSISGLEKEWRLWEAVEELEDDGKLNWHGTSSELARESGLNYIQVRVRLRQLRGEKEG